ncbi:MAG TPA: hypothetical protein VJV58_07440, partial [Bradyrhizobium sp.]|uniref:hypothetical protein n=1 Tax=Bradyrhizobium sp. TaxID=376 RepID=UPI002B487959
GDIRFRIAPNALVVGTAMRELSTDSGEERLIPRAFADDARNAAHSQRPLSALAKSNPVSTVLKPSPQL